MSTTLVGFLSGDVTDVVFVAGSTSSLASAQMKRGISTYRCDLRSRRTISNDSRVPSDANNEQAKILPILPSMMRAYMPCMM